MRVRKFTALAAGAALLMAPAVALAEEGDDSVDDRATDRRGQEVVDIARDEGKVVMSWGTRHLKPLGRRLSITML
jgi:hypothetical protein